MYKACAKEFRDEATYSGRRLSHVLPNYFGGENKGTHCSSARQEGTLESDQTAAGTRSLRGVTVFAIGHSTRPIEEFIGTLRAHGVRTIVDIRTIPRSRHNPQFNGNSLALSLCPAGIGYIHLKELGGLRRPAKDSQNAGWRNTSFRGFADYMQTEEFAAGLGKLAQLSKEKRVAIMCAEGSPFRCHRSLVADALIVRGGTVVHIASRREGRPHKLTPFARVKGTTLTYPG